MSSNTMRRAGLALALTTILVLACIPVAFAADTESTVGTSTVTITKAPPAQISVTVPQSIPLTANADTGVFLPLTKFELINTSDTPVHVSKIQVIPAPDSPLTLTSFSVGSPSGSNKYSLSIYPYADQSGRIDLIDYTEVAAAPKNPTLWSMGAKDSETASLSLVINGEMDDLASVDNVKVLDIVWTVASGAAS